MDTYRRTGGHRAAWLLLPVIAAGTAQAQDPEVFTDGFEPPEGQPACFNDPDPLNAPDGYVANVLSWEAVFFGQGFPSISAGGLSPVGSFTFREPRMPSGTPVAGTYITVPFTPAASTNYKIEWYGAQTITSRNYRTVKPARAVYVTISPCPGDFRMTDYAAPRSDELSARCRSYSKSSAIYYSTIGAGNTCSIQAGQTYYLNILFADPANLDPATDTCVQPPLCDANFGSL